MPDSVKVVLDNEQLRTGKILFGGHFGKSLHCVSYAQIPKANFYSNLY